MDAITSRLWNICFANDDEYVSTDVTAPLLKLPNWTHHPIYILIRITAAATSEAGSAYPELSPEIIQFFLFDFLRVHVVYLPLLFNAMLCMVLFIGFIFYFCHCFIRSFLTYEFEYPFVSFAYLFKGPLYFSEPNTKQSLCSYHFVMLSS